MALYSLKKISLLAESRQAYLRGVSGYNTGWVRAFAEETDAYYARRISARVEEMGAAYAVEVAFDSGATKKLMLKSAGAHLKKL